MDLDLKNYKVNPHREQYGWTSNNSIYAELGMDYTDVCKRINDNGEPDMEDIMKPENMMNMFQTINTTLNDKINNKEIDMNDLFGEASGLMNNGMMENMMGMFGNMMGKPGENNPAPDLNNMMNMMNMMHKINSVLV